MKKLIAVILSVILIMVPNVAFAKESVLNVPNDSIVGYLTDDEGNTFEVEGFVVETAMVNSLDTDLSVTYGFNINTSTLSSGSGQHTEYSPDTTLESDVYLTIYYNTQTSGLSTTISFNFCKRLLGIR